MSTLRTLLESIFDNDQSLCVDLMYRYTCHVLEDHNIEYKAVDSYGGEEQGRDFYAVQKFTSPNFPDEVVYAKFQGWYESYNGSEYEEWFFVEPKEKTIVVYE